MNEEFYKLVNELITAGCRVELANDAQFKIVANLVHPDIPTKHCGCVSINAEDCQNNKITLRDRYGSNTAEFTAEDIIGEFKYLNG